MPDLDYTTIPKAQLRLSHVHANIDVEWGPYASLDAAKAALLSGIRKAGKKFGVVSTVGGATTIEEYMFTKDNATDNDIVKLVLSSDDVTGTFDYTIGSTTSEQLSEAIGANKIITIGTYIASVGRVGTSSSGYYVVCYTDEDGVFHRIVHETSESSVGTETTKEFAEVETINSTSELGFSGVIGGIKKYQGNTMLDLGGVSESGTLGNAIKHLISLGVHIDADDSNNVFSIKNINNETIGSITLGTNATNGAAELTFVAGSNQFTATLPNLGYDSSRQMLKYIDAGGDDHDLIRLSNLQIKTVFDYTTYEGDAPTTASTGTYAIGDLALVEKQDTTTTPATVYYVLAVVKSVTAADANTDTIQWQKIGSINNVSLVADQVSFTPNGGLSSTTVQDAIEEVNTKIEGGEQETVTEYTLQDYTQDGYYQVNDEMVIGEQITINERTYSTPNTLVGKRINLSKGDTLEVYGYSISNTAYVCVIVDANNVLLAYTTEKNYTSTPFTYTAVKDCSAYLSSYVNNQSYNDPSATVTSVSDNDGILHRLGDLEDDIDTINGSLDALNETTQSLGEGIESIAKAIDTPPIQTTELTAWKINSSDVAIRSTVASPWYSTELIPLSNIDYSNGITLHNLRHRVQSSIYSCFILDKDNNVLWYDTTEEGDAGISSKIISANDIPSNAKYLVANGVTTAEPLEIDEYKSGLEQRVEALEEGGSSDIASHFISIYGNKAEISLIDDDLPYTNDNTKGVWRVKEIFDDNGIKCTFGASPKSSSDVQSFTADDIAFMKMAQNEGFTFEVHPNHANTRESSNDHYNTVSPERLCWNTLCNCRLYDENGIFYTKDVQIVPGGYISDNLKKGVGWFTSCYIKASGGSYNKDVDNPLSALQRVFIDEIETKGVSYVKGKIDDAVTNKAWLILGSHSSRYSDIDASENTTNSLSWINYREVVEYANAQCPMRTFTEVYKERKPMFVLAGRMK